MVTLRHLIKNEPDVAVRILAELTGGFLVVEADAASDVSLNTQITTDTGRPDVEIRTSDCLVYVEVKDESGLGERQLERYREALHASECERTRLILLSRYAVLDQVPADVVHRRWIQVAENLEGELSSGSVQDETTRFLVAQFVAFLQFKGLAMAKVDTIQAETVRSLRNLCEMLNEAANRLGVPSKRSFYWPDMWMGINLDGQAFSVGLYLEDADQIEFLTGEYSVDADVAATVGCGEVIESELPTWTLGNSRWRNTLDLSANDGAFYGLTATEQLKRLETFLKQSLESARKIERVDS